MKRVLLVGGPADGQIRTIDDGLTQLYYRERDLSPPFEDTRVSPRIPAGAQRYVEVVIGEQRPLRVFKLAEMQDDDVLHRLADFYAKSHEEASCA